MKRIVLLLTISCLFIGANAQWVINPYSFGGTPVIPDTAKFNFSLSARPVSGWYNFVMTSRADQTLFSGTDQGITITTTAASGTNWTPEGTSPAATSAQNSAPASTLAGWPGDVGLDYAFNKKSAAPANAAAEHWTVSGLTPFATYKFEWLGSRTTAETSRTCYYTIRDNTGVTTSALHEAKGNTSTIVTLTGVANASGIVYLSGYGGGTTANSLYVYYNALKIYKVTP
ncbi:hypothetical protein ACFS6H_20115 [Terrimonas rubra]|uniref:Uncharacterized protein n=1 Tax=Terrimonas rubra TaxID=1035890 RepID=A0ABW6ADK0_9BACT